MEKYVVDTNIFFNMEAGIGLGQKTEEVARSLTGKLKGQLFMPPRIVEEFLSFFEDKEQPFLKEFLAGVTVKSPDVSKLQLPASVFYGLVDDIRGRSYRGLRVGEEEIENAARTMMGREQLDKKTFQITVGKAIKGFRDRYRQATRVGFLDSLADLDLIMLAKEQDAYLVSTDEGVIKWGRLFGVKEMAPSVFGAKMG